MQLDILGIKALEAHQFIGKPLGALLDELLIWPQTAYETLPCPLCASRYYRLVR